MHSAATQLSLLPAKPGTTQNDAPLSKTGGQIIVGDALSELKKFPDEMFQSCVTSPPYWGLRDYGIADQIGAEVRLDDYIQKLVAVFREVKRTLANDGTFWLNIGDAYTSGGRTWRDSDKKNKGRGMDYRAPTPEGLKPKDLIGLPWRLAFALQADGWYLRSEVVWYKPNAQPESVKDRPARAHEHVFLLTKEEHYFYDHEAVREKGDTGLPRNQRSVWQVNTEPYPEAHFATFPRALVVPCILAGSKPNTVVLDPFFGSGTVGVVSAALNRNFVGIELNPEYAQLARKRLGW
jgi:site-specific DNA-methyltransferase (cytosine-N4-specific)